MKNLLLIVLLSMVKLTYGQNIKGQVIDEFTKEPVPFATIQIVNLEIGVISDSLGKFEINKKLPESIELLVKATLYEDKIVEILSSNSNLIIALVPSHLEFEEVVVSSPLGLKNGDNAFRVDRLQLNTVTGIQSNSLPDALQEISGVQMSSLGSGIGKPVIRGMQGLRILTMINGVRLENQQWGGDHTLGVQKLGLASAEVIKGPSSLLYGPDAFGGVLYLVDAPYAMTNSTEIELSNTYNSMSNGNESWLGLKVSKNKFRFNFYGLYNYNGDYQAPNGMYAINSRFQTYGIKSRVGYIGKDWLITIGYTGSANASGLPGHEHDEDAETEEEHENELFSSKRELGWESPMIRNYNHVISLENKIFMKKSELNLIIAHTINSIREFEDNLDTSALSMDLNNSTYNFKWKRVLNESWDLALGAQGMFQQNVNDPNAVETLIPNYNQLDNGFYSLLSYEQGRFNLQFGGRFDNRVLSVGNETFNYSAGNFSIGMVQKMKDLIFRANLSSGYRIPHVSELFADGEHEGSFRYEIGDRSLNPEKSIQMDTELSMHKDHFEWSINPFYNYITNYIYLQRIDSIFDGLPVYQYQQFEQSSLYGVDVDVHYHPHFAHWLHLQSNYAYVRGESVHGESFSLMPQPKLMNAVKVGFESKKKFKVDELVLSHNYYFPQLKVTDLETPSIDYHLINMAVNMSIHFKQKINLSVGVKNLLNESYINHLSRLKNIGLVNPGRNFYASVRWTLNYYHK